MTTEQQIVAIKELRRDIDATIQRAKALPGSPEVTLSYRKLQEGVMWLGMELKRIAEWLGMELKRIAETPEGASVANPYPNSKDPSNTKIDPTADGLKL
jgi:hypothetical protein